MKLEDVINKRNTQNEYRVLSHILFWTLSITSAYFQLKYSFNIYRDSPIAYLAPLVQSAGTIAVFYPLMYIVLPQFLTGKRWVFLIISVLVLTFLYTAVLAIGDKLIFQFCTSCLSLAKEHSPDHISVIQRGIVTNILYKGSNYQLYIQLLSSLILPVALKMSMRYYDIYVNNLKLEKEKMNMELSFLKAQVNPHFLFNTLNNLYGLVMQERTDQSIKTINRLSQFLRYTLDNADKNKILLSEEISLMNNYVELEKLRLNHTDVEIEIDVDDNQRSLPPLLLIPLLENAFKYNIDRINSKINIFLNLDNDILTFKVQNGYAPKLKNHNYGGLGIQNLKKRLALHYGDDYTYTIYEQDSVYTASLILKLG